MYLFMIVALNKYKKTKLKAYLFKNSEYNKRKKLPFNKGSFFIIYYFKCYSTLKAIGKLYLTPTGIPRCFPGIILGNDLITLIASSCNLL